MKFNKLVLFLILCFFVNGIFAQKTWEKPYQKWNKEDSLKILNSSPWVLWYQSIDGAVALDKQAMTKQQSDLHIRDDYYSGGSGGSRSQNLGVPAVFIRLQSALPVRQAIVRLQQLNAGYDRMDQNKRAEFDNTTKYLMDCPLCKNFYIITMNKSVNASKDSVEEGLFQTMNFQQLKGNIWLVNEKGEKQELAQFIPAKGEKDVAVFFFPRRDSQGNNFIDSHNKSFKIVFNNEFFTPNNPYSKFLPKDFEFDVPKLIMGENVAF